MPLKISVVSVQLYQGDDSSSWKLNLEIKKDAQDFAELVQLEPTIMQQYKFWKIDTAETCLKHLSHQLLKFFE